MTASQLIETAVSAAGKAAGASSAVQTLDEDYAKFKQEAEDLKQYTKAYLAAQFTLQLLGTMAMVGMFLLTLKAQKARKG